MKQYIYSIIVLLFSISGAFAQNNIEQVLRNVEENNKSLNANSKMTDALKLEANTGKFLDNPTAEYERLWGNRNNPENQNNITIKQSLDFPTTYGNKNKIAQLKSISYDYDYMSYRQDILLNAKDVCIDIIYYRKLQAILEEKLQNAQSMMQLYDKRLESGDANQLEVNKIRLELLNAENAERLNRIALETSIEQLQNLNGGVPISFNDNDYYLGERLESVEVIVNEYLNNDPYLKSLTNNTEIAKREVKLNNSLSLPKFDLGYRREGASGNVASNGFVVGVSIPLFENKNTVKAAKAQAEFANATLDENFLNVRTIIQQMYLQAMAYDKSKNDYKRILEQQRNVELINKAMEAGYLSVIDYFVEISTIYETRENYLEVERDYYKTLAQIYKYRL